MTELTQRSNTSSHPCGGVMGFRLHHYPYRMSYI